MRTKLIYADDSRVHGLSISSDGNTAYLAVPAIDRGEPNGLRIVDVSDIQARRPLPQVRTISTLYWPDGASAQHTIPIAYGGRPFLVFVDEGGSRLSDRSEGWWGLRSPAGATRIIDISDVRRPRIVSKLKLEIQMPEHAYAQRADTEGNGIFGYQAHYCSVDRQVDATTLACSYFQSGIRVFDIRNPYQPREIAYFNPPAQVDKQDQLQASFHVSHPTMFAMNAVVHRDSVPRPNLTADWCMAQVRFYQPRNELWTHCTDNGFMILKFTNGAYPLPPLATSPVPPAPREQSTSAELSVASPGTSAQVHAPKAATNPTPSIRSSGGRFALSAARLRLAYGCMIVPQLDERSVEQLINAAPPSKSGKGTNSVTARP